MKIILCEFGYICDGIEAEAFQTKESCKEYFVNELKFVTEEQFNYAWDDGSFNRSWGTLKIYKSYEVL